MSTQEGLADLIAQVKVVSSALERGDARTNKRIDQIEASVNEMFRKTQRPGFSGDRDDTTERSDAAEMVRIKHHLSVTKAEPIEFTPSAAQIDEAVSAQRGLRQLLRHGDMNRLDVEYRKSLSSFSFGANQFVLAQSKAIACSVVWLLLLISAVS